MEGSRNTSLLRLICLFFMLSITKGKKIQLICGKYSNGRTGKNSKTWEKPRRKPKKMMFIMSTDPAKLSIYVQDWSSLA